MLPKRLRGIHYVCLGLGAVLIVVALLPGVFGISLTNSDCLTIKPSAYEGGTPVCWAKPSPELQGILNAQAYSLGYDVQPDGTYKKMID